MASTIYDVAKLADVSTATVSRVINQMGNVRPKTEQKIKKAMKSLNFTPNSLAQSFASNKSYMIGFVTSLYDTVNMFDQDTTTASHYYIELLKGINSVLEKEGYSLLIINAMSNIENHIKLMLSQKKIDGLIVGQLPEKTTTFRDLVESKHPIVYIGHIHQYNKGLHIYAQYNQYLNRVLEYFMQQGHNHVLFVCIRDPKTLIVEWEDLGYSYHNKMNIEFVNTPTTKAQMKEIIEKHFNNVNHPTAIFSEVLSDIQPIISTLNSLNLTVPTDVSLMSVEHIKNEGENYYPHLTNIYVPVYDMGRYATNLLLDYMSGSQDNCNYELIIDSNLIERDSVVKKDK